MLYIIEISNVINILLSLFYQAKGKQALPESNLSGILLMTEKKCQFTVLLIRSSSDIFRVPYAFKNSFINFCLCAIVSPL